jgi:plasmid stabilization system protein ParE
VEKRAKVVYLPPAVTDLEAIADYLCLSNPEQAIIFRDRIDTEISRLARVPHLGVVPKDHRLVRDGYRLLIVLNYEAAKKPTFSRRGAKAQRKANSNFFNFFMNLCGFAPLCEPVWLFNRFLHSFIT